MRAFHALILVSCFFCGPVAVNAGQPSAGGQDSCIHLDPTDFYLEMKQALRPVVIDTRNWKAFRRERIRGALLAENREALARITDTLDRDRPVFLYCEYDDRSATACSLLIEKGFRNVYYLNGGILAWKEIPYETDRQRVRRRQY